MIVDIINFHLFLIRLVNIIALNEKYFMLVETRTIGLSWMHCLIVATK